jgi:hypothetical protein
MPAMGTLGAPALLPAERAELRAHRARAGAGQVVLAMLVLALALEVAEPAAPRALPAMTAEPVVWQALLEVTAGPAARPAWLEVAAEPEARQGAALEPVVLRAPAERREAAVPRTYAQAARSQQSARARTQMRLRVTSAAIPEIIK